MRPRALIPLLCLLAACDEPTVITHVDKLSHMSQDDLRLMQGPDGIPVEMHGQPFRDATPEELAAALRPPASGPQEIRFHAVAPGTTAGWRLVLHFNPKGNIPNAVHDCRLGAETETAGILPKGFSVNATFCKGADWQAHGFLRVLETGDTPTETLSRSLRQLFTAMFRKNTDPER